MLSGKTSERSKLQRDPSGRERESRSESVVKGATLLAETLDQDFCPSLPAGRFEKDSAAA